VDLSDDEEREQAVTAGAAAVVIAILVSGRAVTAFANPDELIDGAFVLAERFVARAEERAAHIKKARTPAGAGNRGRGDL
jgi:hypothetical protein